MKKVYLSSEQSGAPLSGAIEVNGLIFISGQIHIENGQLVGENIVEKLKAAMKNVSSTLQECGLTTSDIIRIQLYLTDLSELPALNKAYVEYFAHPLPTRTAIGVSALPLGASLEIDVVAARPE